MILLDTDVMVDVLRKLPSAIQWLKTQADEEIILPGFVVMELLQGCRNASELRRLKRSLSDFNILWPRPETCNRAIETFSRFYLNAGMGIIDAIIGQLAVDSNLPLYSFNKKHYGVIPGLDVRIPYRR